MLREHVHMWRQGPESRVGADLRLQSGKLLIGTGLGFDHPLGHLVGDGPDAVTGQHRESGLLDQPDHAVVVEPARIGVATAGQGQVAGQRLGQHQGVPLGDQQAEHTAATKCGSHPGQGLPGDIDHFKDPVTDHHVSLPRRNQVDQTGRVSLQRVDAVGHAGIGGPALE